MLYFVLISTIMESREVIISRLDWVEKIAKVLKGNESFSYQSQSEYGKRHEVSISVIWDQEAHDVAQDFNILARIWPRLNIPVVLQTRQNSLLNQLDRIRFKRLYGLSSIDGYCISSCIFDQNERKTITIILNKDGDIDLTKCTVKIDQKGRHQEIALVGFPGLANCVFRHIYDQVRELTDKNSNSPAIASIESVLQTLLAIVENRLAILLGNTTPIPMDD